MPNTEPLREWLGLPDNKLCRSVTTALLILPWALWEAFLFGFYLGMSAGGRGSRANKWFLHHAEWLLPLLFALLCLVAILIYESLKLRHLIGG